MGVRQLFNQHPAAVVGIVVVLIAACLTLGMWMNHDTPAEPPRNLFFTDDEGNTLFESSATQLAPIDHNGKPAVQASVFTCDGGKTRFVAYLVKYSDDYRRAADRGANPPPDVARKGELVKRPGDATWLLATSPEGKRLMEDVKCPDGGTQNLTDVLP